jgi:uroporphyrinogen decarboxylase
VLGNRWPQRHLKGLLAVLYGKAGLFGNDGKGGIDGVMESLGVHVQLESIAGRQEDGTVENAFGRRNSGADRIGMALERGEILQREVSVARSEEYQRHESIVGPLAGMIISMLLPDEHPLVTGVTSGSLLVDAYRGKRRERLPIWLMRQAGRSLPEYRALREGIPMLDSCLRPEIASELTLQPVRRHKVDAAIFFSDIVIPLRLAGIAVEIVAGVGPVLDEPIRTRADLGRLRQMEPGATEPIEQAVALSVAQLGATPLIGFAGAPFTVASYLIEGGPSRELPVTRDLMKNDPELWAEILTWVAQITTPFLRAQINSGASAIQLFDSWAGRLSPDEYRNFAAPYSKMVMDSIADLPVARVHFGTQTGKILPDMFAVGATVMGVDQATPLDWASEQFNHQVPLQGNIDPDLLASPWEDLKAHTLDVLRRGKVAPAHVVNLGHGVPPGADPDVITRLVELVHEGL